MVNDRDGLSQALKKIDEVDGVVSPTPKRGFTAGSRQHPLSRLCARGFFLALNTSLNKSPV